MSRIGNLGMAIMHSALFIIISTALASSAFAQVIFHEGFESGWGTWSAGNGIWEIGTSTVDPNGCHSGSNCAGTVLSGDFPGGTSSRIESASIQLPAASGREEIHLRFWLWFAYNTNSGGTVQVNVYNGSWSGWANVGDGVGGSTSTSAVWSVKDVDLTPFAGKLIKIGFSHTGGWYPASGWTVDDIEIVKALPAFTGTFEGGWGSWGASNGVWEVGAPTGVGPSGPHSGAYCAGTVLNGNYPGGTSSRLESASFQLPSVTGSEEIYLRFWHWFAFNTNSGGTVQVNVYNGSWTGWTSVGDAIGGYSSVWSARNVDLTPFAGKLVKIGFLHLAGWYVSTGWYIDDVTITGVRPASAVACDFDGDKLTDIGIWRPSNGFWYILGSQVGFKYSQWGSSTDIEVPGDYEGDGKIDTAVWRPSTGTWYIVPSNAPATLTMTAWGMSTDKPIPADYDGDGKTDIAVWRPSTGTWYILTSNSFGSFTATPWGTAGDIPVPADYDEDGKADLAVWRPSNGIWYILLSGTPGSFTSTQWGVSGDKPVPGDYDGDGKADFSIWRPGNGYWYVRQSKNPGSYFEVFWGAADDIPVAGDYDGDGITDLAVWRPALTEWYILPSKWPGTFIGSMWGVPTDRPLPMPAWMRVITP